MTEFHEWYMVFATKEDAANNGHPDAPYLEDYGLTYAQFCNYVSKHHKIRDERASEYKKEDKRVEIYALIFSLAPIISCIVGKITGSLAAGWIFLALYICVAAIGAYWYSHLPYKTYNEKFQKIHDENIELYLANLRRYQEKYNEQHKNEQQNNSPSVDRLSQWTIKESRSFTQKEIDSVTSNIIVESEYGKSVCFTMKSGGQTYIPLYTSSAANVGESIDMRQVKVLTLGKTGEADILRIKV
ncbi:MAG: hypothetical protein IJR42_05210 [Paludibacteraceae bacterium]|nr:hypothetical protein [Paludibacteraceae bacterium]